MCLSFWATLQADACYWLHLPWRLSLIHLQPLFCLFQSLSNLATFMWNVIEVSVLFLKNWLYKTTIITNSWLFFLTVAPEKQTQKADWVRYCSAGIYILCYTLLNLLTVLQNDHPVVNERTKIPLLCAHLHFLHCFQLFQFPPDVGKLSFSCHLSCSCQSRLEEFRRPRSWRNDERLFGNSFFIFPFIVVFQHFPRARKEN